MQVLPSTAGQVEGDNAPEAQILSAVATITPLLDLDDSRVHKTTNQS